MGKRTKFVHRLLGDGNLLCKLLCLVGFKIDFTVGEREQGWILFFRNKDETIGGYLAKKKSPK